MPAFEMRQVLQSEHPRPEITGKLLAQEEFLGWRQSFALSGERSVDGTEM